MRKANPAMAYQKKGKIKTKQYQPSIRITQDWCAWDSETLVADADDQLESPLAVLTLIQANIRKSPADVSFIVRLPEDIDESVWLFEHLRLVCLQLNHLVALLLPECIPSVEECREMKAGEWQYLCAAHSSPQPLKEYPQCSAIDYIIHTLDGAGALLNNTKLFPSRVTIPLASKKHFSAIARRLYRVFAHAWFHHRVIFDEFENETSLYRRFFALCTVEFK
ncbi:hypothetical protein HK100_005861, partial [Physocladia obscura]